MTNQSNPSKIQDSLWKRCKVCFLSQVNRCKENDSDNDLQESRAKGRQNKSIEREGWLMGRQWCRTSDIVVILWYNVSYNVMRIVGSKIFMDFVAILTCLMIDNDQVRKSWLGGSSCERDIHKSILETDMYSLTTNHIHGTALNNNHNKHTDYGPLEWFMANGWRR